jgi:hypothetical protein
MGSGKLAWVDERVKAFDGNLRAAKTQMVQALEGLSLQPVVFGKTIFGLGHESRGAACEED